MAEFVPPDFEVPLGLETPADEAPRGGSSRGGTRAGPRLTLERKAAPSRPLVEPGAETSAVAGAHAGAGPRCGSLPRCREAVL